MKETLTKTTSPLRPLGQTLALAAGMMTLIYILLGIYPFGDGTVLTGDLNAQYINYFAHFRRFFLEDAGFAYGFGKSLGGGLLGIFAYYVSSPLNLLYLLSHPSGYAVIASVLLFLKIVLACLSFRFYIFHKFPALGWQGTALSLCYGFCSYAFVYAQNIMWHDVVILLPLVLYGIDRILSGKPNLFYIVFLSLAIFANFYIAYMVCIFAVLYCIACLCLTMPPQKTVIRQLSSFAGGSLVAGGLTMVLLLPVLLNVGESKGNLLEYAFSLQTNFPLYRLPEKLFWGSFSNSRGDAFNGLPLVYGGILALFGSLCFFISRKISLKEKGVAGGVLLFLTLSFWVSGLDVLWHGLKPAVWFPYRNSFLFVFTLLLLSAFAFAKEAVGKKELLLSGGILGFCLLLLLFFSPAMGKTKILANLGLVLLVGAGLFLLLTAPRKGQKVFLSSAVLVVIALELALNGFYITNQFEKYPLSTYEDFVADGEATIQAIETQHSAVTALQDGPLQETGAYRLEKNFFRSLNDPMLLNYKGISHFGSTQDAPVTNSLHNLGYRGYAVYQYGSTAFSDSVLGIRYLFTQPQNTTVPIPAHWQGWPATPMEVPYPVYNNPYALPLIFTIPGQTDQTFSQELVADTFAYQNSLYRALSGDDQNLLLPVPYTSQKESGFQLTAQQAGYYYALAEAPQGQLYDLALQINGQDAGGYFTADHGGVINLGWLEAGQTCTLAFTDKQGAVAPVPLSNLWFYCLPPAKLEQLSATAENNSGTFVFRDGDVSGSITADAGLELLFTSIPYDQNWVAVVNGTPVETTLFGGGFLAIPLEPGENTFSLQYKPAGVQPGLILTLISMCALAFLVWRQLRKILILKTKGMLNNKEQ